MRWTCQKSAACCPRTRVTGLVAHGHGWIGGNETRRQANFLAQASRSGESCASHCSRRRQSSSWKSALYSASAARGGTSCCARLNKLTNSAPPPPCSRARWPVSNLRTQNMKGAIYHLSVLPVFPGMLGSGPLAAVAGSPGDDHVTLINIGLEMTDIESVQSRRNALYYTNMSGGNCSHSGSELSADSTSST